MSRARIAVGLLVVVAGGVRELGGGVGAVAVFVDAVAADLLGTGMDLGIAIVAVAAAEARGVAVVIVVGEAARDLEQHLLAQ